MQEEGAISSKFSAVQLTTPSKGTVHELDSKSTDSMDSPHVSTENDDKAEGASDEAIANTSSNITVDSNIVAEVLVSS